MIGTRSRYNICSKLTPLLTQPSCLPLHSSLCPSKTPEEVREQKAKITEKDAIKKRRREEQEENVARKARAKEEKKEAKRKKREMRDAAAMESLRAGGGGLQINSESDSDNKSENEVH